MTAHSIVRLDQKLSRAVEVGRGIRLEAPDLDLLAKLGLFDITHRAKTEFLKEQAECREAKIQSIIGGNTGSISTERPTEPSGAQTSTSGGTTTVRSVSAARQRLPQTNA
jgi:hypothetical protein